MKRLVALAVVVTLWVGFAAAQEYKLAKSTGKLEIYEVNSVSIEGYNGNEIVFSSLDSHREKDKRAEGLRSISANGVEDNTGLGLSVVEKGDVYEVRQMKKMDGPKVKIMVPKGVSIYYRHTSPYGSDIKLKNVESAVDISTVHNGVHLDNVTGPLSVKSVHGEVEVNLGTSLKSPITLSSTHGLVDVSVPVGTKADVLMSAGHGEIFVDPALNLEVPKTGDWVKFGSSKVEGKINGGGLELALNTQHGNVYLRKK